MPRRFRIIQAKLRSTTHRFGKTTKLFRDHHHPDRQLQVWQPRCHERPAAALPLLFVAPKRATVLLMTLIALEFPLEIYIGRDFVWDAFRTARPIPRMAFKGRHCAEGVPLLSLGSYSSGVALHELRLQHCFGDRHGDQHGGGHGRGGEWPRRGRRHPGWDTRLPREFWLQQRFGDRQAWQHGGGHDPGGDWSRGGGHWAMMPLTFSPPRSRRQADRYCRVNGDGRPPKAPPHHGRR